jgi:hypothetical protein
MATGMPVESPVRWKSHAGLYVQGTVMLKTRSTRRAFPAKWDLEW